MGHLEPWSQYQRHLHLLSHFFSKLYKQRGGKVTLMLWFCLSSWLRCSTSTRRSTIWIYSSLSFKTIKEIKQACGIQYGTTSPYTTGLIQELARSEWLIPFDWKMISRTCLSTSEFLQFWTSWQDEASQQAQRNAAANPPLNITVEWLMGSGAYQGSQRQLQFDNQLISQIRFICLRAWEKVSSRDSLIFLLLM